MSFIILNQHHFRLHYFFFKAELYEGLLISYWHLLLVTILQIKMINSDYNTAIQDIYEKSQLRFIPTVFLYIFFCKSLLQIYEKNLEGFRTMLPRLL
jgi:hypothetical protein